MICGKRNWKGKGYFLGMFFKKQCQIIMYQKFFSDYLREHPEFLKMEPTFSYKINKISMEDNELKANISVTQTQIVDSLIIEFVI
jgi:hypothetical protein